MLTAFAQYTTGTGKAHSAEFIDGPRAFSHVLQSAQRGGLTFHNCDVGQDLVTLHFTEDTNAQTIVHKAVVTLMDVDATERQAVKEWAESFGIAILTDNEDA